MGFLDWLSDTTEKETVTERGEAEREESEEEAVLQLMEEWRDEVHRGVR